MNNHQLFWDNRDFSNDSSDKFNFNSKTPKNFNDLVSDTDNNDSPIENKKEINNIISSPFSADSISTANNFDEEKLKEILPEHDQYLIDNIIISKKYYFPNDLKIEKGVFRDNQGNLLQLLSGKKEGFNIPKYIMDIGVKEGLIIVSHNHINGLVIPSLKDIRTLILAQSKYNFIYSPNKTGLFVNENVSKNEINKNEISNKYEEFISNTKLKIEKLYPDYVKRIKSNYRSEKLEKRLDDLYRSYYVQNQEKIAKEINILFKNNKHSLKLYIL